MTLTKENLAEAFFGGINSIHHERQFFAETEIGILEFILN